MQCPYCAEDIREEAIICRYCGGDLRSFAVARVQAEMSSFEERITHLEKEFSEAKAFFNKEIREKHSYMSFPINAFPANAFPIYGMVMGLISALASAFAFRIYIEASNVGYPITSFLFLLLAALLPLPLGILVGAVWDGRHPGAYIVIGLGAGLLAVAGQSVWTEWYKYIGHPVTVSSWPLPLIIAIFPFGTTWLFFAGGLIGDMLADKWNKEAHSARSSRKSLLTAIEILKPGKSQKERWELIKMLGPQLIGTVGVLVNTVLVAIISDPMSS